MTWVQVESAVYSIQDQVELTYGNILEIHRVRCVKISSGAPEFQSECSFRNGKCTVTEGWVTKGPVEAGEWRWEVELKPGEYSKKSRPPPGNWVQVESAVYSIQDQVELTYGNILEIHRVRCVKISSGAPEFQSMCHFDDGQGEVTEGWVTKGPVEAGEWRWEVELKPGE